MAAVALPTRDVVAYLLWQGLAGDLPPGMLQGLGAKAMVEPRERRGPARSKRAGKLAEQGDTPDVPCQVSGW